jgi:hypothetical protein
MKVAEVPVAGRKLWKLLVPAAVILIAAAIGGAFYLRSRSATPVTTATPLTEKDTVVLADFTNSTGDPVFDDALKQALGVQLGQSCHSPKLRPSLKSTACEISSGLHSVMNSIHVRPLTTLVRRPPSPFSISPDCDD